MAFLSNIYFCVLILDVTIVVGSVYFVSRIYKVNRII